MIVQGAGGGHSLALDSGYAFGSVVTEEDYILSPEEGACDYLGGLYNADTGVVEIVAFAPRYLPPET